MHDGAAQPNYAEDFLKFERATFFPPSKASTDLIVAKMATLRVNANLKGLTPLPPSPMSCGRLRVTRPLYVLRLLIMKFVNSALGRVFLEA